jgi:Ribbon-helix-helix protein, copG family
MSKDHDEDIELGEEVEVRRERPSGPVVAVRIPRDVLAKLSDYASKRGTSVSEVVRQAAIRLAAEASAAGPYYVTGVRLEGPTIAREPEPTRGGRVLNKDYLTDELTVGISRS